MLISKNKKVSWSRYFLTYFLIALYFRHYHSALVIGLSFYMCDHSKILKVLMRVEQEQRVTEDARRFAEQDVAAQRYAAQVLQVLSLI